MTIIELTQKIKFREVGRALKYYYPNPKIGKETMNRYKEIMKEVSEYKIKEDKNWYFDISVAKPFKFYDKSKKEWVSFIDYGEEYHNVSGINKKEKEKIYYAVEFKPWQVVANYKINPLLFNYYTSAEIIAHFLWEMTFCGYEQETVQEEVKELNRRIKKVEEKYK